MFPLPSPPFSLVSHIDARFVPSRPRPDLLLCSLHDLLIMQPPPPENTPNTPHKSARASTHFATAPDLDDNRAELRLMAHNKMKCLDFDSWMDIFVRGRKGSEPPPAPLNRVRSTGGKTAAASIASRLRPRSRSTPRARSSANAPSFAPQSFDQCSNPFKGMRAYTNEKDMYGKIVRAFGLSL